MVSLEGYDTTLAMRDGMADSVRTAPSALGCIQEFDPEIKSVTAYLERLQLYFIANRVEDDRRVPT